MARTEPLTLGQLAELARKSLDNAVDLLDEADGLIAFGKFARGYAVAILAGEGECRERATLCTRIARVWPAQRLEAVKVSRGSPAVWKSLA